VKIGAFGDGTVAQAPDEPGDEEKVDRQHEAVGGNGKQRARLPGAP
jgi:hypothetical protein